jgi:hypothetical protein
MTHLINQIMESTTSRNVDKIVEDNIEGLNPFNRIFLCAFANKAKRRIIQLRRMTLRHTELKYLN